jgi:hypothetical protein
LVDVGAGAKVLARGRQGGDVMMNAASEGGGSQNTTLHVNAASVIDSTSVAASKHGNVRVAVYNEALKGTCTTDPARTCAVDAPDCTVGLTTGQCIGLNPDTDDTIKQFIVRPEILSDKNITGCTSECR